MPRFETLEPEHATGKASALLAAVEKKFGQAPNLMKTLAQSPASMESLLGLYQSLGAGVLDARIREQIALAVAGVSSCGYCASAHTAMGHQLGLDEAELQHNLKARSSNTRTQVALEFARTIVLERGWVSDADVQRVRDASFSDEEIIEIIANVAMNLFANYFNHIAQTINDFPEIKVDQPVTA